MSKQSRNEWPGPDLRLEYVDLMLLHQSTCGARQGRATLFN